MAPDGRENRWRLMTSPHVTERVEDWAQTGARHGLAFAFPLLDRRLVEFSLSLPTGFSCVTVFAAVPFVTPWPMCCLRRCDCGTRNINHFRATCSIWRKPKTNSSRKSMPYGQNESVRGMIDLAHLRRLVEAFPSPERVREEMRQGDQPAAAVSLIIAAHILEVAAYLEQHGEQAQSLSRRARL